MKKNTNIELIRIVAAALVILVHTFTKGGILEASRASGWNYDISHFLFLASICCVNLFALVSGYVAGKSKHPFASVLTLYLQVVIDYLLVCLVMLFINREVVTLDFVSKAFLPIINDNYWYYTAFVLVGLVSSFIDFSGLNTKHSIALIVVILILGSFLPTFNNVDTFVVSDGYNFAWIFILFIIGKLLRNICENTNYSSIIFLVLYIALTFLGMYIDSDACSIHSYLIVTFTYFPVCLSSICLFMFLIKIKIRDVFEKPICFVSSFALASYLVHVQKLPWNYIIDSLFVNFIYHRGITFIGLEIGSVILIYVICMVIDFPRYFLFKKIKIKDKLIKLENKLFN